MKRITVAICTYNRAEHLPPLITSLNQQKAPIPFEILVVNNNSTDRTEEVLGLIGRDCPIRFRHVIEGKQGIVHARNRAIEESMESDYLAFIDDDELPGPRWLEAAADALHREGAHCVGGKIRVNLPDSERPGWLDDDLLYFLGKVDNGSEPFWIKDRSTPVWSGNVAYRTSVFSEGLRFDDRYNRKGKGIGGGSDEIMFHTMLDLGHKIRYRPDMVIKHIVDKWRISRTYFLKLHYKAGWKMGRWGAERHGKTFFGIPPFMVKQALMQSVQAIAPFLLSRPGSIRQAMNSLHAIGMVIGRFGVWRAK
jgi:glycosyltransferase involved in cell wall biosynthesis